MSTTPKKGTGRRLNRERVLDAATEVARREGTTTLSISAVAKVAGCTPMALYYHVKSRADLIQAIVDRAANAIAVPEVNTEDPATEIENVLCAFYDTLSREAWLVPHLMSGNRGGAGALPLVARALGALEALGLTKGEAWHAFSALVQYTYGAVLTQSAQQKQAAERAVESSGQTEAEHVIRNFAMAAGGVDPRSYYQMTVRRQLAAIIAELG